MTRGSAGNSPDERRHYIRLDNVLPVKFRLVDAQTREFSSGWLQGFTRNFSKGGICLEVIDLPADIVELLQLKKVELSMDIELSFTAKRISSLSKVAWVREPAGVNDKFLLGLIYTKIDPKAGNFLMQYVRMKRTYLPALFSIITILAIGLAVSGLLNFKLIEGNKQLVAQLVKIVQESGIAKQEVKGIARQRQKLQLEIQALQSRIDTLENEKTSFKEKKPHELEEINVEIEKLSMDRSSLQEELNNLQRKENIITTDLLHLDKMQAKLEKANIDKMYTWLKVHQDPHTGLVGSFEGDKDTSNWAFLYDQALVVQAYVYQADYQRAKKILDFFKHDAARSKGMLLNAYYTDDGAPAEYIIHSGPNMWLGIAILHYTNKTLDRSYLGLTEDIAQEIMRMQEEDSDGGIRGGPDNLWYSTEHNLDAYAFFTMLNQVTESEIYAQAGQRALDWLVKHTYGRPTVPIKRGKGDSTIATDTYAWSIAAVGPQKLEELGMNPESIMEFAEENCSTEAAFLRPDGELVSIKGFDFAPERNLARGGIISSEWTAQMVVAFKIMADYYYSKGLEVKGLDYTMKADEYMASLEKMIISSPSPSGQGESCLPYATAQYVDTGHGWMTPKGSSTGSVSGTAYTIFAYYNYNPLKFEEKN